MPIHEGIPMNSTTTTKRRFDLRTLWNVHKAVRHVRAHTPDSRLADLADHKLTALELELNRSTAE